ncbi:MAG: hypothetical protein AB1476_01090 [Candidatus Hadarchaeota archaeon]
MMKRTHILYILTGLFFAIPRTAQYILVDQFGYAAKYPETIPGYFFGNFLLGAVVGIIAVQIYEGILRRLPKKRSK